MGTENSGSQIESATGRAVASQRLFHVLVIAVLGFAVYANTFHGAFVLDDETSIVKNAVIRNLGNFLVNARGYTFNPRRFIGYLTFALNYQFSGLDVTGYHIVNLAVHIVTALLVYALVLLTFRTPHLEGSPLAGRARLIALFAALLFVAHPVQTQAVTYIVQRLTSLATMFYLAALCLYAQGRLAQESVSPPRRKAVSYFFLSLLAMVLAMKTKEISFTLPMVIVLYEFAFFRVTLKKKLIVLIPVLLMLLIIPFTLLNIHKPLGEILSDVNALTQAKPTTSRGEYLLTQFSVITTYIRLLFWPTDQNLDYDYPIYHSLATPQVFFPFLLIVGLLALAVSLFVRSGRGSDPAVRLVSFGIFWFFIALGVESSVIPITDVIFEHRVYLPSVGAFIAFSTAFMILSGRLCRGSAARIPMLIAVALLSVLSVATFARNEVWRDKVTLWEDVVRKSPGKVRPYNNLGAALSDAGRQTEAIQVLRKAISIKPDHPEAYYNLGRIYLLSGEAIPEAVRMFSMALLLRPDYYDAYVNLAAAYVREGRYGDVVKLLGPVINDLAERPDAHFNLGVAYFNLGDNDAALRELAFVGTLDPLMASNLERFISQPANRNVPGDTTNVGGSKP